ncbi:MAG: protein kinase [Heteroscytonema crispum UTEX LB 1556]
MIGQLLAGHYRVLEVLGAGGFGETYIAEDTHRPGNPKCVVKHLKPASNDSYVLETARKLFTKEAETLEKLGYHDQIPRLLAYFEENQEFYLVQELINGHPLAKELQPGIRWTENQVLEMLQQVLGVLEFVHSQGVIHRDIKPDNIIRRVSDHKLVLIDFGAIKQVRNQTVNATGIPSATVAIGTPGYMSSEQARGLPRPSSDIYALGMIGIQALTGVYPHELPDDQNTGEILWQHLAAVSPALAAVLNQMTRYHFKDRYHTAAEALQAVRELGNSFYQSISQPTQPKAIENIAQPPQAFYTDPTIAIARVPAPAHQQVSPSPIPAPLISSAVGSSRNKLPALLIGVTVAGVISGVGALALFKTGNFIGSNREQLISQKSEQCRLVSPTGGREYARIRPQPQREVDAIQQIKQGEKVLFVRSQGDFVEVKLNNGTEGWVFGDQIQPCDGNRVIQETKKTSPQTPTSRSSSNSSAKSTSSSTSNTSTTSTKKSTSSSSTSNTSTTSTKKSTSSSSNSNTSVENSNSASNSESNSQNTSSENSPDSSKDSNSSSDTSPKVEASSQKGFKDGSAHGYQLGKVDGAGNGGKGAMHLDASCSKEASTDAEYDRGYKEGCEQSYKQAFDSVREEILKKEQTEEKSPDKVTNSDKKEQEKPDCQAAPDAPECKDATREQPTEPTVLPEQSIGN